MNLKGYKANNLNIVKLLSRLRITLNRYKKEIYRRIKTLQSGDFLKRIKEEYAKRKMNKSDEKKIISQSKSYEDIWRHTEAITCCSGDNEAGQGGNDTKPTGKL